MKILYRPAALKDIQDSANYIKTVLKNLQAAQKLKSKILQGTSLLKENPNMGALLSSKYEGLESSVRFIVVNRQLVFYEVQSSYIEILRVLDGRTDYLTHLFELSK